MNNNLKKKLASQRKWREEKISSSKPKRWSIGLAIIVLISTSIILMIMYGGYVLALPGVTSPTITTGAVRESTTTPSPVASSTPAPISMTVCVGNLHVRYTPNGSVRGYLKEGELVVLKLDTQGKPITQKQNNENWILVSTPVEGWANTKFLCK